MSADAEQTGTEPRKLTEEAARALCAHLAATHEDRATHQWLPRPSKDEPGTYEVVKVAVSPPLDNLSTEIRADERPETPDDPRTAQERNVGPWVTGG
jgi:hypothetical protein